MYISHTTFQCSWWSARIKRRNTNPWRGECNPCSRTLQNEPLFGCVEGNRVYVNGYYLFERQGLLLCRPIFSRHLSNSFLVWCFSWDPQKISGFHTTLRVTEINNLESRVVYAFTHTRLGGGHLILVPCAPMPMRSPSLRGYRLQLWWTEHQRHEVTRWQDDNMSSAVDGGRLRTYQGSSFESDNDRRFSSQLVPESFAFGHRLT